MKKIVIAEKPSVAREIGCFYNDELPTIHIEGIKEAIAAARSCWIAKIISKTIGNEENFPKGNLLE